MSNNYDLVVQSNSYGILQSANLYARQGKRVLAIYDEVKDAPYSLPLFDSNGSPLTIIWKESKILFHKKYIADDLQKISFNQNLIKFLFVLEQEFEKFPYLGDVYTYQKFLANKVDKFSSTSDDLYKKYDISLFFRSVLDSIVMFFTGSLPPFKSSTFIRTLFSVLNGLNLNTENTLKSILDNKTSYETLYSKRILKTYNRYDDIKLQLSYFDTFAYTKKLILDDIDQGYIPFSFDVEIENRFVPKGLTPYLLYLDSDGHGLVYLEDIWFIKYLKDQSKFVITNFSEKLNKDLKYLESILTNIIPTLKMGKISLSISKNLLSSTRIVKNLTSPFTYRYSGKMIFAGESCFRGLGSDGTVFFPSYIYNSGFLKKEDKNILGKKDNIDA